MEAVGEIMGKTQRTPLAKSIQTLLARVRGVPTSAEYEAWRHRFLLERLRLGLWIVAICFLTFIARDLYGAVFHLKELEDIPQEFKDLTFVIDGAIGLGLFASVVLYKTRIGRLHPGYVFLGLSWSTTLVPQIIGTCFGLPIPDPLGWSLVFLFQATIMPVCWHLHSISNLAVLTYYVVVNQLFGFTTIKGEPIYSVTILLYLFWFCFICNLSVYLYERLQRSEFESKKQLKVFLHGVSHDLRNPVTGTLMVLRNLQKNPQEPVPVSHSVLERMIQGSDRQLILINSLLEAHASDLRGILLHCQPIQLRPLVQSAIADLEALLEYNQTFLKNLIPDNLPLVSTDPTQLWRVFSNLITNAVKHNPPGLTIIIRTTIEPRMIRCYVEDNGEGLTQQQSDHLFDLYFRSSPIRNSLSLGLGLYLCRQIITAHGGEIGVTSSLGTGSIFWFTLPIDTGFGTKFEGKSSPQKTIPSD